VEGLPAQPALDQLAQGIKIQDYHSRPAHVRLLPGEPALPPRDPPVRFRKTVPTSWIELTLTEGRNRQVRRMTAAVGYPTLRLVRVAIGDLTLAELQPGEWRELTPEELQALQKWR
jgi:23S rRNA pseudouridine2457 synthase